METVLENYRKCLETLKGSDKIGRESQLLRWIFDSKSRMIIASEIGDCDENAMIISCLCVALSKELNSDSLIVR